MKSFYAFLLGLFVCSTSAMADQKLYINGDIVESKVVTEITFDGDNAILKYADETNETYDMAVVSILFEATDGPVVSAINDKSHSFITLKNMLDDAIILKGLNGDETISIYNIKGIKELTVTADDEEVTIGISELQSGIHILKAGNYVIKFNKK